MTENKTRRNQRKIIIDIMRIMYENKTVPTTKIISKANISHENYLVCMKLLEEQELSAYLFQNKKKYHFLTDKGYETYNNILLAAKNIPEVLR